VANFNTSKPTHAQVVSGLFPGREGAERAYRTLIDLGYTKEEINVLMSEGARERYFPCEPRGDTELGTKVEEGAGAGGGVGLTVGPLVAAIASTRTSVAVPGLGVVVAGPFAAALAGAGVGGMTGGLVGALVRAGIPEKRARAYEQRIRQGRILISVPAHSTGDAHRIEHAWGLLGDVDLRR